MAASKVTQGEATVSSGQEELHALILTRGGLYCCTEPCLCDGGLTAFVLGGPGHLLCSYESFAQTVAADEKP